MKILVLAEDLRITGTSEGIVSRSFIVSLRKAFPEYVIDLIYFKKHSVNCFVETLPVNNYEEYYIKEKRITKSPIFKIFIKIGIKLFNYNSKEKAIIRGFSKKLNEINTDSYDCIFVRSAGLTYFLHRALRKSPHILEKAILNFHDPYPISFSPSYRSMTTSRDLFKLFEMMEVVSKSRAVTAPSEKLGDALAYLYGSTKVFRTLPHQFQPEALNINKVDIPNSKNNKSNFIISYHGAVQLNQNIEPLIDAVIKIKKENNSVNIVLVLRIKGNKLDSIVSKYQKYKFIKFLPIVEALDSYLEQHYKSDLNIILDTCGESSEILVGKAPMLGYIRKPILALTPKKSELRRIIIDDTYLASCDDAKDIESKLLKLILERQSSANVFGAYFSEGNFSSIIYDLIQ